MKVHFLFLIAGISLCSVALGADSEKDCRSAWHVGARDSLIQLVREKQVPAFVRRLPGSERDLPVVLVTQSTYPALEGFLRRSIGMPVELSPGSATDHGMFRAGTRLMDFETPGRRGYRRWDPHGSGVLWRPFYEWLDSRARHFRNHDNWGTYDSLPKRVVEVAYELSPEEMKVAEAYHRGRFGGLWRVEYFYGASDFGLGAHLVLWNGGGREHCYNYGTCSRGQDQMWELESRLYHDLGVHEDLKAWFERAEVVRFQQAARDALLAPRLETPEEWERDLAAGLLDRPELWALLQPALAPEQGQLRDWPQDRRMRLLNFTLAHRLIADYRALVASLGINEGNYLDQANPRAAAVLVYEGDQAADSFWNASYDYRGGLYSFINDGNSRPLPR